LSKIRELKIYDDAKFNYSSIVDRNKLWACFKMICNCFIIWKVNSKLTWTWDSQKNTKTLTEIKDTPSIILAFWSPNSIYFAQKYIGFQAPLSSYCRVKHWFDKNN
jgi:hypothetical protein